MGHNRLEYERLWSHLATSPPPAGSSPPNQLHLDSHPLTWSLEALQSRTCFDMQVSAE